jgi:hypothetical protein
VKGQAAIMAVALAVVQAAADEPAPAPATPAPSAVNSTLDEREAHTFDRLQPLSPKAVAHAGGKHRWKKITGVLCHFPLLIWDDVRPPDETLRDAGLSSQPWTQIVGWHPGTIFNEDCAIHEPGCAIFTASR